MEIKKHYGSFSEAIREGAKLRPQNIGGGTNQARTTSCAYVAGLEAVMGSLNDVACSYFGYHIYEMYPYLKDDGTKTYCPQEGCDEWEVGRLGLIFHLNDWHHLPREAIADWLESEEEKLGYVTLEMPETQPASALSGDRVATPQQVGV